MAVSSRPTIRRSIASWLQIPLSKKLGLGDRDISFTAGVDFHKFVVECERTRDPRAPFDRVSVGQTVYMDTMGRITTRNTGHPIGTACDVSKPDKVGVLIT